MDKPPWDKDKILKLTISTDFYDNLKELQFSSHSLKEENGKHTLRVKVPYNYHELDDFELKSLELLGIQENWLTDIALDSSNCCLLYTSPSPRDQRGSRMPSSA